MKTTRKRFWIFCHNANSVRNILYLERNGKGYNVSLQVLDAILCHNGEMLSKNMNQIVKKQKNNSYKSIMIVGIKKMPVLN